MPEADVVMCAAQHTGNGDFRREEIAAMKKAFSSSISRGTIVDEAALIEALQLGRIAGAGLDVTAQNRYPEDSPLWTL